MNTRVIVSIATDFPGIIKQLASIGFQTIDLCSPVGYAKAGFASVAQYKGSDLPGVFANLGVSCHSSHFSLGQRCGIDPDEVPSLDGPRNPTMDDVKRSPASSTNSANKSPMPEFSSTSRFECRVCGRFGPCLWSEQRARRIQVDRWGHDLATHS